MGLEKVATEDTKLLYMTTGVLLQKVVSAKSLVEFTHIFIDEVRARRGCALAAGIRAYCVLCLSPLILLRLSIFCLFFQDLFTYLFKSQS